MKGSLLIIASTEADARIHRREWMHTREVLVAGLTEYRKIQGLRLRDAILTRDAEHVIESLDRTVECAVRSLVMTGNYADSTLLRQLERLGLA